MSFHSKEAGAKKLTNIWNRSPTRDRNLQGAAEQPDARHGRAICVVTFMRPHNSLHTVPHIRRFVTINIGQY
jgi:hypothetical protein